MKTQIFSVTGITCGRCVDKIETAFADLENIESARVLRDPDRLEINAATAIDKDEVNRLFAKLDLTKYRALDFQTAAIGEKKSLFQQLFPLALIISYLLGTVLVIGWTTADFSMNSLMFHYMAGFFLIFSFFKFLNLRGFVDAFHTYDPLAKTWPAYGYFYAAFELFAGIGYLTVPQALPLNLAVLALLGISSWGVIKAVRGKNRIQCACLGTVFNLPMTKVTVVENVLMIAMALTTVLR